MMHLATLLWVVIARVYGLPIFQNGEETPRSSVAEATSWRQNGTALMDKGLSSLAGLLHRKSEASAEKKSHVADVMNSSEAAAVINTVHVAALTAASASQESSDLLRKYDVLVGGQSQQQSTDAATSLTHPVIATTNEDQGPAIVTDSDETRRKEVQAHVVDVNADTAEPSSHKSRSEVTSSAASTASGRKQVVRSQSPSLQTDGASRQADPRGFFWLHWELLRLAKPGLLIFGIFVLAVASMTFWNNKSGKQEKDLNVPDRNERLLAVAQMLRAAKEDKDKISTEPSEVLQTEPKEPGNSSEAIPNSTTDSGASELQKMHLMEELGFMVPSTDDLFLPPSQAAAKKEATSAPHLSPEIALSEETRSRRTAIINILRNLPDLKDRDSSKN